MTIRKQLQSAIRHLRDFIPEPRHAAQPFRDAMLELESLDRDLAPRGLDERGLPDSNGWWWGGLKANAEEEQHSPTWVVYHPDGELHVQSDYDGQIYHLDEFDWSGPCEPHEVVAALRKWKEEAIVELSEWVEWARSIVGDDGGIGDSIRDLTKARVAELIAHAKETNP